MCRVLFHVAVQMAVANEAELSEDEAISDVSEGSEPEDAPRTFRESSLARRVLAPNRVAEKEAAQAKKALSREQKKERAARREVP